MKLRELEGFHPDMAASDTLHALGLGAAKDAVGSILLDTVEYHDDFAARTSYDEVLQSLCAMLHEWCAKTGLNARQWMSFHSQNSVSHPCPSTFQAACRKAMRTG